MNRNVLITGGAGFIGSNFAKHLLARGASVRVLDNLARPGVEHNLAMLRRLNAHHFEFIEGDVREARLLREAVADRDEIYHFAAQVAVTQSIADPRHDVETNLLGTFNVLEAVRLSKRRPFMLFTSTNKVYGDLAPIPLRQLERSFAFVDRTGVNEDQPLDFHSPYGCSKGAADQYVHDYARIYGVRAVVFRMSCIAGPQQLGNEDQGWLAHFLYSIVAGRPITIYGDGRQVRDILNVADLIAAFEVARAHAPHTAGHVYNIGGGAGNAASLLEVLDLLERITGKKRHISFSAPRQGDQHIFITDFSRFSRATGWAPRYSIGETAGHILEWAQQNYTILREIAPALRGIAAANSLLAS
jgi:CDP-paratose 2-epimerase